eukprot:7086676-Ditylum_brightwellii.AAC.1
MSSTQHNIGNNIDTLDTTDKENIINNTVMNMELTENNIINKNSANSTVNVTEHNIINNKGVHAAAMHNMPVPNATVAAFPNVTNAVPFPNL